MTLINLQRRIAEVGRGGLGGGPWADLVPLVGSRVRVTVEKIGDDHE